MEFNHIQESEKSRNVLNQEKEREAAYGRWLAPHEYQPSAKEIIGEADKEFIDDNYKQDQAKDFDYFKIYEKQPDYFKLD